MTLAAGVGDTFAGTVTDGPLVVAALVAALVGLVSFLSPCVLPLVPGYLSYVTGLSGVDVDRRRPGPTAGAGPATGGGVAPATAVAARPAGAARAAAGRIGAGRTVAGRPSVLAGGGRVRVLAGAILFVLGFTAVFVSLGALFGGLGGGLLRHQAVIERVLGAVVIILGLAFLGLLPGLQREYRLRRLPSAGLAGAPLLGVVFGLGWTPCLGPTLGAVQALAYSTASAGRGALLSAAYCLGLGIPFVLTAFGFRWVLGAFAVARRNARWVGYAGGVLLVVLGALLVTGAWDDLMIVLRGWAAGTGIGTSL